MIWIDVRTPEEYQQGHLADAVNIPHDRIGTDIAGVAADADAPIHLYCGTGRRSGFAQQTLRDLGYTNVHNEGAYDDLRSGGGRG